MRNGAVWCPKSHRVVMLRRFLCWLTKLWTQSGLGWDAIDAVASTVAPGLVAL